MKQVTLISFYEDKPPLLAQLIQDCTALIQNSPLHRVFRPYHPNQVHGTITGMEKLEGYTSLFNKNTWQASGAKKVMDFSQLLPTLQDHLPMNIQFGGFPPAFDAFSSFGLSPYERSFQVQWPSNRFTIIGWPHRNGAFAPRQLLNELRQGLYANCNIKHKWGTDNDLFMVLGEIAGHEWLSDTEIAELKQATPALENTIRDYLSNHKTEVAISMDDVYIAQYEAETLAPGSTVPYRITRPDIDVNFIRNLYE